MQSSLQVTAWLNFLFLRNKHFVKPGCVEH
uniref:Uncharacterized protein n=1 Tax=Rhizophora mucronata TaxID=61149 RepID=A0A2P2N917_RHIMU